MPASPRKSAETNGGPLQGQPNRKQAILLILLPPSSASKPVISKPGRKQFYVARWLWVRAILATKPPMPIHRVDTILSRLSAFARVRGKSPFQPENTHFGQFSKNALMPTKSAARAALSANRISIGTVPLAT
jgi:hypothetical protein